MNIIKTAHSSFEKRFHSAAPTWLLFLILLIPMMASAQSLYYQSPQKDFLLSLPVDWEPVSVGAQTNSQEKIEQEDPATVNAGYNPVVSFKKRASSQEIVVRRKFKNYGYSSSRETLQKNPLKQEEIKKSIEDIFSSQGKNVGVKNIAVNGPVFDNKGYLWFSVNFTVFITPGDIEEISNYSSDENADDIETEKSSNSLTNIFGDNDEGELFDQPLVKEKFISGISVIIPLKNHEFLIIDGTSESSEFSTLISDFHKIIASLQLSENIQPQSMGENPASLGVIGYLQNKDGSSPSPQQTSNTEQNAPRATDLPKVENSQNTSDPALVSYPDSENISPPSNSDTPPELKIIIGLIFLIVFVLLITIGLWSIFDESDKQENKTLPARPSLNTLSEDEDELDVDYQDDNQTPLQNSPPVSLPTERYNSGPRNSNSTFFEGIITLLMPIGSLAFFAYLIALLIASWTGYAETIGWGWNVFFIVLFMISPRAGLIPVPVGAFLCAFKVWEWHWFLSLCFAAPFLVVMVLFLLGMVASELFKSRAGLVFRTTAQPTSSLKNNNAPIDHYQTKENTVIDEQKASPEKDTSGIIKKMPLWVSFVNAILYLFNFGSVSNILNSRSHRSLEIYGPSFLVYSILFWFFVIGLLAWFKTWQNKKWPQK